MISVLPVHRIYLHPLSSFMFYLPVEFRLCNISSPGWCLSEFFGSRRFICFSVTCPKCSWADARVYSCRVCSAKAVPVSARIIAIVLVCRATEYEAKLRNTAAVFEPTVLIYVGYSQQRRCTLISTSTLLFAVVSSDLQAAWTYYDNKRGNSVEFEGRDAWNKQIKEQEKQRKNGTGA